MTLNRSVDMHRHFSGTCCNNFHPQIIRVSHVTNSECRCVTVYTYYNTVKGKGKVIMLQARCGPEGEQLYSSMTMALEGTITQRNTQCMDNVTLRHISVTTIGVERQ